MNIKTSKFSKLTFIVLTVLETITLVYIGYLVFTKINKGKNVLGAISVKKLSKDNYTFSTTGELQGFYEPERDKTIKEFPFYWTNGDIFYTINSDTLNERENYLFNKPTRTYRIITLGDSHVYGSYVNTSENWTEILEDSLNTLKCTDIIHFEVINLGVEGYGPEYIKERFKLRGLKYEPDLIIWQESGFDFDRVNEIVDRVALKYLSKMSEGERKEMYINGKNTSWDMAMQELYKTYGYQNLTDLVGESWKQFYNIRENTDVLVTSYSSLTSKQKRLLRSWAKNQTNVNFFFGLPDYKSMPKFIDGHPDQSSHVMIAEKTFDYLLKNNYFSSCKK